MPTIKIVDFTSAKLSYFAFKNGQETGTEFIVLWRQFVCLGLFTPCLWGEIQRLRKCQVILNRIVLPIYREFLTKMEDQEDVEESLTHKMTSRFDVTSRFDRAIQMRARKINNFYRRKLKFWNCVFQTL